MLWWSSLGEQTSFLTLLEAHLQKWCFWTLEEASVWILVVRGELAGSTWRQNTCTNCSLIVWRLRLGERTVRQQNTWCANFFRLQISWTQLFSCSFRLFPAGFCDVAVVVDQDLVALPRVHPQLVRPVESRSTEETTEAIISLLLPLLIGKKSKFEDIRKGTSVTVFMAKSCSTIGRLQKFSFVWYNEKKWHDDVMAPLVQFN